MNESLRALRNERNEEAGLNSGNSTEEIERIESESDNEQPNVEHEEIVADVELEQNDRQKIECLSADNDRLIIIVVQRLMHRIETLEKNKNPLQIPAIKEKEKSFNSTRMDAKADGADNEIEQLESFVVSIKNRSSSLGNEGGKTSDRLGKKDKRETESRSNYNRFPVYKWSVRYDGLDNGTN